MFIPGGGLISSARFTGVQNMTSISLRPPEVAARIVPGHWEADLIKGARNLSSVGTLVERVSRYVMLARMDNSGADAALAGTHQPDKDDRLLEAGEHRLCERPVEAMLASLAPSAARCSSTFANSPDSAALP